MQAKLNIRFDPGEDLRFESQLPPWDDVIVFLHRLRPIYLQNEATHFYRICNFISHRIAHEYVRAIVSANRDLYSGRHMRSMLRISVNEVVLNSEKALANWLNSHEYHRDSDKREFIESLNPVFPLDASRVIFLSLLTDKLKAMSGIAALVSVILGKSRSAEGTVRIDEATQSGG